MVNSLMEMLLHVLDSRDIRFAVRTGETNLLSFDELLGGCVILKKLLGHLKTH